MYQKQLAQLIVRPDTSPNPKLEPEQNNTI